MSADDVFNIKRVKIEGIPTIYLEQVRAKHNLTNRPSEIEKFYEKRHNNRNESEPHLLGCCIYIGSKNEHDPYENLYIIFAIPYIKQVPLVSNNLKYITFTEFHEMVPKIAKNHR